MGGNTKSKIDQQTNSSPEKTRIEIEVCLRSLLSYLTLIRNNKIDLIKKNEELMFQKINGLNSSTSSPNTNKNYGALNNSARENLKSIGQIKALNKLIKSVQILSTKTSELALGLTDIMLISQLWGTISTVYWALDMVNIKSIEPLKIQIEAALPKQIIESVKNRLNIDPEIETLIYDYESSPTPQSIQDYVHNFLHRNFGKSQMAEEVKKSILQSSGFSQLLPSPSQTQSPGQFFPSPNPTPSPGLNQSPYLQTPQQSFFDPGFASTFSGMKQTESVFATSNVSNDGFQLKPAGG